MISNEYEGKLNILQYNISLRDMYSDLLAFNLITMTLLNKKQNKTVLRLIQNFISAGFRKNSFI